MKNIAPTLLALALLAGCERAETPVTAKTTSAPAAPAPGAYPLATCVVSDEKLGGMGEAYVFKHEGTEVRLCCEGCLKDFRKDPAKYLAKIEAAKKGK